MNELTLDGKTYISSRRGAEITGYARDYVGQLCREGHVEARLVGRNWYVLESSIREHRFGKKEETTETVEVKKEPPTWEPSRYKSEEPVAIPTINSIRPMPSVRLERLQAEQPVQKAMLSDMQSAWQEWFTKKDMVSTEEHVEDSEESFSTTSEEAVTVPIVHIEEPAELVMTEITQVEPGAPVDAKEPLDLTSGGEDDIESENTTEPFTHRQSSSRARNLILQSIFIAIALIAVTITTIGTGFVGNYIDTDKYGLFEINLISGVSVYNK